MRLASLAVSWVSTEPDLTLLTCIDKDRHVGDTSLFQYSGSIGWRLSWSLLVCGMGVRWTGTGLCIFGRDVEHGSNRRWPVPLGFRVCSPTIPEDLILLVGYSKHNQVRFKGLDLMHLDADGDMTAGNLSLHWTVSLWGP